MLGSRGNDGLWLWDVKTGEARKILPEDLSAADLAFSPEDNILAVGGHQHLWFHDLRTGNRHHIPYGNRASITRIGFSPDGKLLALGCHDGAIRVWDVQFQKERTTLHGHTGRVHDVRFSPDGKMLVSVGLDFSGQPGYDSSVQVWDLDSGKKHRVLSGFVPGVWNIALHPNGTLLASAHADPFVRLWDISKDQSAPAALLDVKEPVWSVAFSPDGSTLAAGSHEVSLWDIPGHRRQKVLKTRRTGASEIGFSYDGQFLAAVAQRPFVKIWNLHLEAAYQVPEKPRRFKDFWHLAFCPSAPLLALVVSGNYIWVWNLDTKTREFVCKSDFPITCFAFSRDERHVAIGRDDSVILWDITTCTASPVLQADIEGKNKSIGDITFNSDGTMIAFSDSDRQIQIVDVETWEELANVTGHTWIAGKVIFSPDGSLLISSSSDGTIRLWGVASK